MNLGGKGSGLVRTLAAVSLSLALVRTAHAEESPPSTLSLVATIPLPGTDGSTISLSTPREAGSSSRRWATTRSR